MTSSELAFFRASRLSRAALPLAVALLLSGCGGAVIPQRTSTAFKPAARPAVLPPAPPSNGVIGEDARALIRLFGEPRLDIQDPNVRKLQFGDGRCVLDAYLYPVQSRREPVTTFAEARKADGTAMDWIACANLLKSR